jgi:23S rRNA pseudouridine955/2504/2580 synthase
VISEDGIIEAPLRKDLETGKVIVDSIKDGAKRAKTVYHVLKYYNDYTLLDLTLVTGRTHQLRVHLQYINHPIVGDNKYGDFEVNKVFEKAFNFKNQFLHANDIKFGLLEHPLEYLKQQSFEAALPKEYINILQTL